MSRNRRDLCQCGSSKRKESKRCQNCARIAAQPTNFEPQSVPVVEEKFEGRPWNDERNNFRMPNWNKGLPVRDITASPLRCAVVDLETSDLWGSGRILCGVAYAFDPFEERIWRCDEHDQWATGKRYSDRELVEAILRGLEEFDIVFAYNGSAFDFPFLRTRALIHGLPPVEPRKIVDPVMLARRVFRFKSNRLDAVAHDMGCPFEKTDLDKGVWQRAMLDGDQECLDQVVIHCQFDVKVLTWVSQKMAPYVRQIDSIGSFRGQ